MVRSDYFPCCTLTWRLRSHRTNWVFPDKAVQTLDQWKKVYHSTLGSEAPAGSQELRARPVLFARTAFDVMLLERFPRCQCVGVQVYNVWTVSAILVGRQKRSSEKNSLILGFCGFPDASHTSSNQGRTFEATWWQEWCKKSSLSVIFMQSKQFFLHFFATTAKLRACGPLSIHQAGWHSSWLEVWLLWTAWRMHILKCIVLALNIDREFILFYDGVYLVQCILVYSRLLACIAFLCRFRFCSHSTLVCKCLGHVFICA